MKWIALSVLILSGTAAAKTMYGPYAAEVVRVIDGDTIEIRVGMWPGLTQQVKLRLAGVNTPEKRGKGVKECEKVAAKVATVFTTDWLANAGPLQVYDVRLGKYAGRVLGKMRSSTGGLAEALLNSGNAKTYYGGKRQRWC